jgi:inhibitor of cysteine peptidase
MIRDAGVMVATVIALWSAPACAGRADPPKTGPQTTTVVISYNDLLEQKTITRSVELSVGDTLQVSLGSNASTGYQWAPQMQISDPRVIGQAGHEVIAATGSAPGAPGSEVWALQALPPGAATVSTTYGRPWPGGEKDAWTFTAQVQVR